jgi:small subunit ribosomal protein S16
MGKIRAPYYRIVVADSRKKRDGRVIEEIGKYHPTEEPSYIEVMSERAQYWLSVGAQPSPQVLAILKLTGDWGNFKGEKGATSTVRVAEPKAAFSVDEKKKPVLKPKAEKPAPAKEEPKAEEPKAEEPKAEKAPADEPKAEEPKAEEPKAEEAPAEEPKAEEPKAEEAPAEEAPAAEADKA